MLDAPPSADGAMDEDRVYVPVQGGTIRAFARETAVRAATGLLVLTLDGGRVVALNLTTGEPLWEEMLPGTLSPPALAKDRVLIGSTNNFLYALEAGNGRIAWKWRTGGDVIGA